MEMLLRIPVVKHGIYLWKLLTKDEKFWQAMVLRRIYTLKERGVKEKDFINIISTLGNKDKTEILKMYVPRFFLKNFIDNLLIGVICAGIFDLASETSLKTFIMLLFFWTMFFSLIDLATYIKVEFIAIDKKKDIMEKSMEIYRSSEKYTFDKIVSKL
ncbi:MAG: hypothetical protein J7L34_08900 [Thermotogaceae bacterium]|nr:hypothetical protein [Thermotogaceae bacterium]